MPKPNPLAQGLNQTRPAARPAALPEASVPAKTARTRAGTVLIGAHFAPEVQTTLKIIAAEERTTMQALLAEGINTVLASRGKPQIAGLAANENA